MSTVPYVDYDCVWTLCTRFSPLHTHIFFVRYAKDEIHRKINIEDERDEEKRLGGVRAFCNILIWPPIFVFLFFGVFDNIVAGIGRIGSMRILSFIVLSDNRYRDPCN